MQNQFEQVFFLVPTSGKTFTRREFSCFHYLRLSQVELKMKHSRVSLLVFGISFICLFLCIQARRHYHTQHHKHSHLHKSSTISEPPTPPPEPASHPPVPANPNPSGGSGNSTGVFDVRSFGAIGDGITDDTDAFKTAWDAACNQDDSAVILVPYGFEFMIQSTIFTGPCQGGLVFQVTSFVSPVMLFFVPLEVCKD